MSVTQQTNENALHVTGVSLRYGEFRALNGVELDVRRGAVHAIIGSNGAGKTSLLQVLAGALRCSAGKVFLNGREVTTMPAWQRARLGLGRAFQVARVFDQSTIGENVAIAAACSSRRGLRLLGSAAEAEQHNARRALEMLHLVDQTDALARDLSQGDRKRLEIAMTVAFGAGIVLLDEPTAGMSQGEVSTTIQCIAELQRAGVTVVLIEHDMDVVFSVADIVTVLDRGRVAYEGTPIEVSQSTVVRDLYLGNSVDEAQQHPAEHPVGNDDGKEAQ
jgi:branched-chain amino acid transport system ATP-binding protein